MFVRVGVIIKKTKLWWPHLNIILRVYKHFFDCHTPPNILNGLLLNVYNVDDQLTFQKLSIGMYVNFNIT